MRSVDRPFKARRRASFVILTCLTVFLLFVVGCSGLESSSFEASQEEEAESAADRPNIVIVLTDDLDYASAQKMPQITS